MIRTWGHATSENFTEESQRSAYGVFQFFEHTLVVLARADKTAEREHAQALTQLVVRLIYDQFKEYKGEPGPSVLTQAISQTHDKLVGLRNRLNLPPVGVEVTVAAIGAQTMVRVGVGGHAIYQLRRGEVKRLGDHEGQGSLLAQDGQLSVRAHPVVALEKGDVMVMLGEHQVPPIIERHVKAADWELPQQATRRLLAVLEEHGANETLMVCVLMDKSPEFIRPTTPASIQDLVQKLHPQARMAKRDREKFEDVKPQWGTGTFFEVEEAAPERERLSYREIEQEKEEEKADETFWGRMSEGLLFLRDHIIEAFGMGKKQRKKAQMASYALVLVFSVLAIVYGLYAGMGTVSQGEEGGAEGRGTATSANLSDRAPALGARSDRRLEANPEGSASRGGAPRGGFMPALPSGSDGGSSSGSSSGTPQETFSRLLVVGGALTLLVLGVLVWKRREAEKNEAAARKAKLAVRGAAIDGTLRDAGGGRVFDLLRGADYKSGLALVELNDEGGGWKIVVASIEKAESGQFAGLSRVVAHSVRAEELQAGRVHIDHKGTHSGKGGARGSYVSAVALELRTTMNQMPSTFIPILSAEEPSDADEQVRALTKAYRWEGILMALRARRARLTPPQRIARLCAVRDEGLLSSQEFDQLCRVHETRESRSLNS